MGKRTKYYAFVTSDRPCKSWTFSVHYSQYAAEKKYGDLTRHYRGNPSTDYDLIVLTKEELEEEFGEHHVIDYKNKTITEKETE